MSEPLTITAENPNGDVRVQVRIKVLKTGALDPSEAEWMVHKIADGVMETLSDTRYLMTAKRFHVDDPHHLLESCALKGWDSYGAAPVTEKAVRSAARVRFVPTVDGGVQAEWHTGGWDIEIAFGPEGNVKSFGAEQKE